MDKMSKEETLSAMKEIRSSYGDDVIVEFSGDGMASLVESGKKANLDDIVKPDAQKQAAMDDEIVQMENTHRIVIPNIQTNEKLNSATWESLQENPSGKMVQMSEDEVKTAYQKSRNERKTLTVDTSEIVNNVYSQTRDNITYNVDGVTFTNAEMKACKEVMKNVIAVLPAKGSDLDYEDYAAMGIASNMVNSYAKENLTEEQADILNRSINEYFDSLVQAEQENQRSRGCFTDSIENAGSTGTINTYYNVRTTLSNKTALSVVQSASNKELSAKIKSLFENADMKDGKVSDEIMRRYKELMTPVYQSAGIHNAANSNSLTDVLEQDISRFTMQIVNAKAVIHNVGHTFSYTV